MELPPPDVNDDAGPSLHAIKQKASAAAWNKVRATLQKAAIESSALPGGQSCILCGAPATHRCTSCAYYCIDCFCQAHSLTNFFHVGEVWEVSLCSERCWISYTGHWWRVLGFLHRLLVEGAGFPTPATGGGCWVSYTGYWWRVLGFLHYLVKWAGY